MSVCYLTRIETEVNAAWLWHPSLVVRHTSVHAFFEKAREAGLIALKDGLLEAYREEENLFPYCRCDYPEEGVDDERGFDSWLNARVYGDCLIVHFEIEKVNPEISDDYESELENAVR